MQILIEDINQLTDLERQILFILADTPVESLSFKIKPADLPDAGADVNPIIAKHAHVQPSLPESFDPNVAFGTAPVSNTVVAAQSPIAPITSQMPNVSFPTAPVSNIPAPAQTATTQSAAATLSNPAQGDTDKNGFPWHPDIHSSSKEKNQDGSWRYKRGADKSVIQAVEAQLRAALAAPAQTAPQAPLATLDLNVLTWPVLIQELTGLLSTNKITNDQITKICKESGVDQFSMLAARPDLFKNVLFRCQQLASVA